MLNAYKKIFDFYYYNDFNSLKKDLLENKIKLNWLNEAIKTNKIIKRNRSRDGKMFYLINNKGIYDPIPDRSFIFNILGEITYFTSAEEFLFRETSLKSNELKDIEPLLQNFEIKEENGLYSIICKKNFKEFEFIKSILNPVNILIYFILKDIEKKVKKKDLYLPISLSSLSNEELKEFLKSKCPSLSSIPYGDFTEEYIEKVASKIFYDELCYSYQELLFAFKRYKRFTFPREIYTHQINPCNEGIKIEVEDIVDPFDNSNHHRHYYIKGLNKTTNPAYINSDDKYCFSLYFQKGRCEGNNNGLTFEVLAALIIDTAEMFQGSSLNTPETAEIISHAQAIINIGRKRYLDREARNVYDTRKI